MAKKFFTFHFSLFTLLLAFALRLYRLDFQSIWWDEGHSILMASAPVAQIPTLPGMDVHPPGYFVALHGWMALAGRSEFALRYLSVGFSLLTAAVLIRFGREMGGRGAGGMAGLLAALSPFYVAYAQEVRMYAMVTFFAAASVWCLWRLLMKPDGFSRIGQPRFGVKESDADERRGTQLFKKNPKDSALFRVLLRPVSILAGFFSLTPNAGCLILYVLTTAASLYTHYFTLFLLAFENLAWGVWAVAGGRRGEGRLRLRRWAVAQAGVALLFAPQLLLAARQITAYANPNLRPPALGYYLLHNWQAYTLGLTFDPARAQPYLWALAALLAGAIVNYQLSIINYQSPNLQSPISNLLFSLGWLAIPLALYFVVLQRRPSYEPRYMMLVTPSLFVLMGLVFAPRRQWGVLFGAATAAIFVIGLRSYFTDPAFFKDDSAGVANWLAAETTPDDIVFVDVPHPFHYYADRIPAPTRYLFVDIHTAADTLNREALGRRRLYWVTWYGSDTDPRGVIPFLLWKQAGPPTGEMQFRGYRVEWYTLSDRPFSLPADLPPARVNFDNVLLLDGLAYSETLSAGEAGWATLHFTLLAPTEVNYKLSLRLRASDGRLLSQVDKPILNDRHFQTAAWPIEDPALNQAINVFTLPLNDPAYTGPLTLEGVVYNADTLAAIAAYGVPTTNGDFVSAQIGAIRVEKE